MSAYLQAYYKELFAKSNAMRDFPSQEPPLGRPAVYYPYASGRYDVRAGLSTLQRDFGNAQADAQVLQLDRDWPHYHQVKMQARAECLAKYMQYTGLNDQAESALVDALLHHACAEHPQYFTREDGPLGQIRLHCRLSAQTLVFDAGRRLHAVQGVRPSPAYQGALDALACQLQEDFAVLEQGDQGVRIRALHLCLPNHWAAQDKIGQDFIGAHAAVPGMERINRQASSLMRSLMQRGPFVRFAWGLASDDRLNHHPVPAPGHDAQDWHGRGFAGPHPRVYVRVERQVCLALIPRRAFLFCIRTYITDVHHLAPEPRAALTQALADMSPASAQYKGLAQDRQVLLDYLHALD